MIKGLRESNRKSLFCLVLASVLLLPLTSVQSAFIPIAITNASFEIGPPTPPNKDDQDDVLPLGWTLYNPEDLDPYYIENYDPVPSLDTYYQSSVTSAPDGSQVGYAFLPSSGVGPYPGGGLRPFGFEQELAATVDAGSYRFSAAVGNPKTYEDYIDGFGGYGLELFARDYDDLAPTMFVDTVFGSVTGTDIGEGLFKTITLNASLDGSSALLGQALGIRMYNQNLNVSPGPSSQTDFDNAQLEFSAVPVPAAVWLFGTALVGLFGFNRRRKRAV